MDQQESEIIQLKAKLYDASEQIAAKNRVINTIAERLNANNFTELMDNLNEALEAKNLKAEAKKEGQKEPVEAVKEKTRQ